MKKVLPLLLLVASLAACSSHKYYKVTAGGGRTYYTRGDKVKRDQPKGYVTFQDYRTGKSIRLRKEDYTAREVPKSQIAVQSVDGEIYRGHDKEFFEDELR